MPSDIIHATRLIRPSWVLYESPQAVLSMAPTLTLPADAIPVADAQGLEINAWIQAASIANAVGKLDVYGILGDRPHPHACSHYRPFLLNTVNFTFQSSTSQSAAVSSGLSPSYYATNVTSGISSETGGYLIGYPTSGMFTYSPNVPTYSYIGASSGGFASIMFPSLRGARWIVTRQTSLTTGVTNGDRWGIEILMQRLTGRRSRNG